MRIALNATLLRAPRTGIGQYIAALFTALSACENIEPELFLGQAWYTTLPPPATPQDTARHARWSTRLREWPGAYPLRRFLWQRAFERGLKNRAFDLYHEPSLWPFETGLPMVMTLHDLSHVRYPQTHPPARLREIERHIDRAVIRAARILVDSAFIAREVMTHFSLPPEKIVVAPLGCGNEFHPRTAAQTLAARGPLKLTHGEYLLCVGTLEPRKNLALALRAHARLPDALRARYPLLIAGISGWGKDPFSGELQSALHSGHVRLTGYLDRQHLAGLIAGARALVYPSLYEGFGLPVLEAMASGVPVIVSRRASLLEVAGEAGVTVDAEDDGALAIALQSLIEDEPEWQSRRAAGLRQAEKFTWQRCADITAQTYRAVLTSS